jgi:hypothetical protein
MGFGETGLRFGLENVGRRTKAILSADFISLPTHLDFKNSTKEFHPMKLSQSLYSHETFIISHH